MSETLLRDIENRLRDLASRVDVKDAQVAADIDRIRADVERLREEGDNYVILQRYVPLERMFWAVATSMMVGLVGGLVAVLTRAL